MLELPLMNKLTTILALVFIVVMFSATSCGKSNYENPNIPPARINVTIDPNSTMFLELNTVGGWLYLEEVPGMQIYYPSQGVIVYRQDIDQFLAYERQPPNEPFKCCVTDKVCTKLLLGSNYPFVKDTCTGTLYNLLDGSIFKGEGQYSLIRYNAVYDGVLLHVYN